ncbi:MAG TPA: Ku protein [Candidatus Binatia bacterium]|nr:Ku protein [Candidatus Binatia bacterium]
MARAMWRGAIQFGLVTIPVRLYLATEPKTQIAFHLLHAADGARIQMKIWCPVEEKIIPRSETVRGYEIAPDRYVIVTDEDLAKVPLKTLRTIEIEQFVARSAAESAVRFVKQAYYVEPEPIGRKAFALLREVLAEAGLTAICKVVIKDREVLAAIDPFDRALLLSTLHWPDEIRSVAELDLPDGEIELKPAERAMARQLVEAMTAPFDPTAYRDEYRDAVMEIIRTKAEGMEPEAAPAEVEPAAAVIDLMKVLEASVAAARRQRAEEAPAPIAEVAGAQERGVARGRSTAVRAARTAAGGSGRAPTGPAEVAGGSKRGTVGPGGRRPGGAPADEEQIAEAEARPVRRRKSA